MRAGTWLVRMGCGRTLELVMPFDENVGVETKHGYSGNLFSPYRGFKRSKESLKNPYEFKLALTNRTQKWEGYLQVEKYRWGSR